VIPVRGDACGIPRIIIAGTHSGCGKTTVARGLMEAFSGRGLVVQPFKVGPDFIDPTYHTAITGRSSRNLDPFMMGDDGVLHTFSRACRGADLAVIEGVMGMFDGMDGTLRSSTADVARILRAPVCLVVDAHGMAGSANAVVRGFASGAGGEGIRGIIFNRIGSSRHRELVEVSRTVPALGWIPRDERLRVESRHLGLFMAGEGQVQPGAGAVVGEACELEAILAVAESAPCLPEVPADEDVKAPSARIGVAQDEAFCFYYQDNLDRLVSAGAVLIPFSPIRDPVPEVDALYLGGGYPELHAEALGAGPSARGIARAVTEGMPVYAECGGLLFLAESLVAGGREYRMAGVFPAVAEMTRKVRALGYTSGTGTGGPAFIRGPVLGHEFHYSEIECRGEARFAISLSRGEGIGGGRDGIYESLAVGSYTHAYFSDRFARAFVKAAARFARA
jgi:cobyrinic acid a,c-diamide synthase